MRERPLKTRGPRPKVEEDAEARVRTKAQFRVPVGAPEFQEGFRECVELFALHRPNKKGVARILGEHCVLLEEACLRAMTRENVARYEGFRQALKELRHAQQLK